MPVKELIEQIGGRERLEQLTRLPLREMGNGSKACPGILNIIGTADIHTLARALLAVLDAQTSPVWGQARFKGGEWSSCSAEHAAMVMEKPAEWVNYECRYLYTAPPAASVPDAVDYSDFDPASQDREIIEAIAQCKGWNACRAAMLAAAPNPNGTI